MANLLPQLLNSQGGDSTKQLADPYGIVWLSATTNGLVTKYGNNSFLLNPQALLTLGVTPGAPGGLSPSLLDANGQFGRLGLNSSGISSAGLQNEIWISPRQDGLFGSGVKSDPYNGSTAALFDDILVNVATNTTINLLPGTYQTLNGVVPKTGWKINGSGRGISTIQLQGWKGTGTSYWGGSKAYLINTAFGGPLGNGIDNVTIQDLTLDGNYAGLSPQPPSVNVPICGIFLPGNNNIAQNVEIIGMYGLQSSNNESFSLTLGGVDGTHLGANCKILNCLIHNYAAGANYTNGCSIQFGNGGVIDVCYDDGSNHGYGMGGGIGTVLTNSVSTANTGNAWYLDSTGLTGSKIINNTFSASGIPMQFSHPSGQTCTDVLIQGNTFTSSTASGACIYMTAPGNVTGCRILGNTWNGTAPLLSPQGGGAYTGFTIDRNYCPNIAVGGGLLSNTALQGSSTNILGTNYSAGGWQNVNNATSKTVSNATGSSALISFVQAGFPGTYTAYMSIKVKSGTSPNLSATLVWQDENQNTQTATFNFCALSGGASATTITATGVYYAIPITFQAYSAVAMTINTTLNSGSIGYDVSTSIVQLSSN